jgi:histidinol-phosphate aminotransferase
MTALPASVSSLLRPAILSLTAYSSARTEFPTTATPSATPSAPAPSAPAPAPVPLTHLDANERPFGALCRYPDPQPGALVSALAGLYGAPAGSLLVCRGSDEAIDVVVRGFCEAGRDAVVVTGPSYGMYRVAAEIQGATVVNVPLLVDEARGFGIDEEGVVRACEAGGVKIVFACSPNNPTGQRLDEEAVRRVARRVLGKAMVVVDEAYVEFCDGFGACSMVRFLPDHPNMIVTRTLSKAFGLAAARVGCCISSPALREVLGKVIAPYPMPSPVTREALLALTPEAIEATRQAAAAIARSRVQLAAALAKAPCVKHVYPSDANFLLLKVTDSALVMRETAKRGLVIRDRSKDYGLANHVRITVGTEEQCQAIIEAFNQIC